MQQFQGLALPPAREVPRQHGLTLRIADLQRSIQPVRHHDDVADAQALQAGEVQFAIGKPRPQPYAVKGTTGPIKPSTRSGQWVEWR